MSRIVNSIDQSVFDPEKLKEAYLEADRLFGQPPREVAAPEDQGSSRLSANRYHEKSEFPRQFHTARIYPCIRGCLLISVILFFVLLIIYLDDIYLVFNDF